MDLSWMQWTPLTQGIFAGVILTLLAMTIWDVRSPGVRRKGFLVVGFTRGERLFLSVVIFFGTVILWMAFLPKTDVIYALPVAAVLILIVVRWG
jgi:predicted small integral membrane protein